VELFPSRLAGESPAGLAAALREAFALVAELDFAARRTAQLVFERVMFEHGAEQASTGDILHAIGQTRRVPASLRFSRYLMAAALAGEPIPPGAFSGALTRNIS
jgi:hypothetical protein